jgi:2-keto-4-pentenoate hydratase/2-oxohepta-3-ene-1,7-dioic acid hydratase in catechol pathway
VRLATYDDGGGPQAGVLIGDQIVPAAALQAPAQSVRGLLHALDRAGLVALGEQAEAAVDRIALTEVQLLAPVPDPEKIICLGYVAGAMPFNDVSARDLQIQNPRWTSGKAVDTFAPSPGSLAP